VLSQGAVAQPAITTYHNDLNRTGLNSSETILKPQNVNSTTFGKLFSLPIDGPSNAQPLYMPQVNIPGKGVHNVLYVVTEHDSVYAFDADSNTGANASPLWKASLLDAAHGAAAGAIPEPISDLGNCGDIAPEVGIVGTPVIDPSTNTIYLVGKTNENGLPVQRLHALDITTGAERANSPVTLQATVSGTGSGSSGGSLSFDPKWSIQRPGLLLLNGFVYIGFASHCDFSSWHGWMLAYNASTMQQSSALALTPNTTGGGVWMSGGAPAAEIINGVPRFFVSTGNGTFDGTTDFANNIVHIDAPNGVMRVSDHFTPSNQAALNSSDADVSAGGVLMLPDQSAGGHQRLLVLAGKEGRIYAVDRDNMGGYNTAANNDVQDLPGALTGLWATPSFFNNTVYFWGCSFQGSTTSESLKSFSLANGLLSTAPTAKSARTSLFPGAVLSISANGTTNGIVWSSLADQYVTGGDGVVLAHDAGNVGSLLWSSDQNSTRDGAGRAVKFTVPTIVNGKVYAGNFSSVNVYGLLPTGATAPIFTPAPGTYAGSVNVSIADAASNASIYYTLDGSTPTASSNLYNGPINLTSNATVTAIAVIPGVGTSAPASAAYTVTPVTTPTTVNLTNFSAGSLLLSGSATAGTQLMLTSGLVNQTGAAYYPVKLPTQAFTTSFTFQIQTPSADGMMFVIQNAGPAAIGAGGGGLGFSGMAASLGVKFDIFSNSGETANSTGLYLGGFSPTVPSQDLTPTGIDLHSGHTMKAALTYDGTTLTMVLTDQVTGGSATFNWTVNIPATVGGTTAYFGFTAATGGLTSSVAITGWNYSTSTTPTTAPDFGLSIAPASVSVQAGQSAGTQITVTPLNGFSGAVTYSYTGLPSGVTAVVVGPTLTFTAASNAAGGTSNVTVTGTSGAIVHSAAVSLTVSAAGSGNGVVSLASLYNINASVNDGSPAANGGFDTSGYAYSANLLGNQVTWNGVSYPMGTPGAPNGVSSVTVPTPAGRYNTVEILGAGVNGTQANQLFSAIYTDGTTVSYFRDMTDWAYPTTAANETKVLSMAYRVMPNGAAQSGPYFVSGYQLALDPTKTLKSVVLPNNRNVVILGVHLTAAPADFSLSVSPSAVSMQAGATASTQLAVSPINGFTGSVSFSATGLPAGVTASFSGFTLTFTATGNVASSTANVTVTATSGPLTHTTSVALTTVAGPTKITSLPAGTPQCASENGTCTPPAGSTASVYFGIGGSYYGKQGVTSAIGCNTSVFGDPAVGSGKACYVVVNTLPSGVKSCAVDFGNCTIAAGTSATVFYGANGINVYKTGMTGTFSCSPTTFGGDPVPNVLKSCGFAATSAPSGPPVQVDLSAAYNHFAIVNDGTFFPLGYADNSTSNYSANTLGSTLTWSGIGFRFGAAGAMDSVANRTVALPAGRYSSLKFLGTGVQGNQAGQRFVVRYTDGSTATASVSLSDWLNPQSYAGETIVSTMPYRDLYLAQKQFVSTHLYGYSIALDPSKTVSSVALPGSNLVVVLAMTLVP
jgi:hypothetical protein